VRKAKAWSFFNPGEEARGEGLSAMAGAVDGDLRTQRLGAESVADMKCDYPDAVRETKSLVLTISTAKTHDYPVSRGVPHEADPEGQVFLIFGTIPQRNEAMLDTPSMLHAMDDVITGG
jgi:hypothetical protein